ncbi:hypothetical protein Leryth_007325, partial [Lithospermum erythrorhizon]
MVHRHCDTIGALMIFPCTKKTLFYLLKVVVATSPFEAIFSRREERKLIKLDITFGLSSSAIFCWWN